MESQEDEKYDNIEEIREDNIEAEKKQQSKSRRRMVAEDVGSGK